MLFDRLFTPQWSVSVNQTDRLSGIADYLGSDGMSGKLLWLAGILAAMLVLIMVLRWTAEREKKRKQSQREQRRAKANAEQERSAATRQPSRGMPRRVGSNPSRRR